MSARWDVLGIGVAAVDDLVYVERFPEPDTKMPALAESRQGGGLTATALVAASRLGARTAYCAVLGDNELSRFTVEELQREGVDCSPVFHHPDARPYHSTIIVDKSTGSRTIMYCRDGLTQPTPDQAGAGLISGCRMLFVDQHIGPIALHALEIAHALGIPVVADIEGVPEPWAEQLLAETDHLIVGIQVARKVTGESDPAAMVRALAGPNRACAAVTAGAQGCWYSERGGEVRAFPAFKVNVIDTTGCGDVFHGAYAACIAAGETVDQAIRVATATAGLKATQPGGRMGIPSRATVDRFLAEQ